MFVVDSYKKALSTIEISDKEISHLKGYKNIQRKISYNEKQRFKKCYLIKYYSWEITNDSAFDF